MSYLQYIPPKEDVSQCIFIYCGNISPKEKVAKSKLGFVVILAGPNLSCKCQWKHSIQEQAVHFSGQGLCHASVKVYPLPQKLENYIGVWVYVCLLSTHNFKNYFQRWNNTLRTRS